MYFGFPDAVTLSYIDAVFIVLYSFSWFRERMCCGLNFEIMPQTNMLDLSWMGISFIVNEEGPGSKSVSPVGSGFAGSCMFEQFAISKG